MKNNLGSSLEAGVSYECLMVQRVRRFVGFVAVGLVVAAGIFSVAVQDLHAEEVKLSPEYIKQTNPELYRQIQAAPKLPPENIDPNNPYPPYPGFFAQPVLKSDQMQDWWANSSFEYSPTYPYLLKHSELKLTYAKVTGNDEGNVWKGAVWLTQRKGRFTNLIGYEIDQKNITSTDGSSVKKDTQRFEETALYELNRYLFVEAGFHWQRLSVQMIKDRYIPYVGIGSYNLLQDILNKRADRLGLHLGYARVTDVYDSVITDVIKNDSDTYNGIYARADFSHRFSDMLTYKQSFVMKHALDATPMYRMTTMPQRGILEQKAVLVGSTKRYDWRWTNSLEFALNQYVGFIVSYDLAFDSNPWPIAVKRDTEFMTGFKFAY